MDGVRIRIRKRVSADRDISHDVTALRFPQVMRSLLRIYIQGLVIKIKADHEVENISCWTRSFHGKWWCVQLLL
jgi:hypothetical protein